MITWLASYPKSGNTWLRIFLNNYWRNADTPVNINALERTPIASSRQIFDEYTGVESANLTPAEANAYRPAVYRRFADAGEFLPFCKIHDAYHHLPNGAPLIPAEATAGVIYIIRNPLDIVPSMANHNGSSLDVAINTLLNEDYVLGVRPHRHTPQLQQRLYSWDKHVKSWVEDSGLPVHVVRYEDMHTAPHATFTEALRFVGIEPDAEQVDRAIAFSSFEQLKQQEAAHGFSERPASSEFFFNSGQVGQGHAVLSNEQIVRITTALGPMMCFYGYEEVVDTP